MSQTAEQRTQPAPAQLKDAVLNWDDPLELESELTEEERMVLCSLETVNTYEGTHDIHALILGRAQTGIQAFF